MQVYLPIGFLYYKLLYFVLDELINPVLHIVLEAPTEPPLDDGGDPEPEVLLALHVLAG